MTQTASAFLFWEKKNLPEAVLKTLSLTVRNIRLCFGWSASILPAIFGSSRRETSKRKERGESGRTGRGRKKSTRQFDINTNRQRKVKAAGIGSFEVSGEVHVELLYGVNTLE